MPPTLVGHAAAAALAAAGVTWVAGVPGESFLPLLDGLRRERIAFRSTVHESGSAFLAAAYGRATRRPAVVAVTRGPGAANALIGIHEAAQASAPVVLIVGQVESKLLGRRVLQAMDFPQVFASVAKKAIEVAGPEQVTPAIMAALRLAATDEQGPVVISVPSDYWYALTEADPPAPPPPPSTPVLPPSALREVVALMREASVGLIVAGESFRAGAHADLIGRLAERTGFGVVGGHAYPDVLPPDHEHWLGASTIRGPQPLKRALTQADTIVFLDHWPGDRVTQGYVPLAQRLAVVSRAPSPAWDEYPQAKTFVGDPVAAARGLLRVIGSARPSHQPRWLRELRAESARRGKEILAASRRDSAGVAFGDIVAALDASIPRRATLVSDAGSFNDWIVRYLPFPAGRDYLGTLSGGMGYAVPAAIGAHLARPDARPVVLTGDGGFLMTGLELVTLVEWRVPATVIVFQNSLWGSIALHQDREFPDDRFATRLPSVPIADLARSIGVDAIRISDARDLGAALEKAFNSEGPSLVEIITDATRPSPASYEGAAGRVSSPPQAQ